MSLNRLIFAAAAFAVIGVTAPVLAPSVLRTALPAHPANAFAPRSDDLSVPSPAHADLPALPQPRQVPGSAGRSVALHADAQGQFETTASINGQTVSVVVDTGATTVALSAETARRLGVMPPQSAFRLTISTANGTLNAAPVVLNQVSVGGITVQNVQAIVVPGAALPINLLGMTYLSRISKFEVAAGELTLRQ